MDTPNIFAGRSHYLPYCDYSCVKLHRDMIQDKSIMICKKAIFHNKHLFQDKIVLDVNCGTAILSMFIASQGAKVVIGIEPTSMATIAISNVKKNNMKNIYILQTNVDKIEELPLAIGNVDIIVSQWQVYLMFDKKLLDSLLKARDRWLKPDGIMFPDTITLHITAAQCEYIVQESLQKLRGKHFRFTSLSDVLYRTPRIEYIPWQEIVSNSATVRRMNLKKMSIDDFSFSQNFVLTCLHSSLVHAFVLYFEVLFSKGHKIQRISSSPFEPRTRWKPILFCFENELFIYPNEQIKGTFKLTESEKKNSLNLSLSVDFLGAFCKTAFFKEYVLP